MKKLNLGCGKDIEDIRRTRGKRRMKPEKIFALHPCQKELIDKYCFKKCGKIIVGGLKDEKFGCLFVCEEEECPYEKDRAEKPLGEVDGRKVIMRTLKNTSRTKKNETRE